MYQYKQYTKSNYKDNIQLSSYVRIFCSRRIKISLCSIIVLFALLHVLPTGLFLLTHFTEDESRNNMISLEMTSWHGMNNDQYRTKIPRIIHQIWISSVNNEEIYERFQLAANACIALHSDYNYTLWTHNKILLWLRIHYSWFLPTYENYRYDMQRIDAMKYLLLFHYGGLYVDLDVKCKVHDLILAMLPEDKRDDEPDIIFHMGSEGISANTDIVGAKRFHPFFKLAVSELQSANRWFYLYHLTIILSAGPTFLYGVYRQFPFKDSFYYVPNSLLYGNLIDGVGGGTWYGKDSLFLIKLMENKLLLSFVMFVVIVVLFLIFKLLKKKK